MNSTGQIILIVIGLPALFLLTQRWFWLIVFSVGGLASALATLACSFHFQILGALGFFFLMVICCGIASLILNSYG